MFTVNSTIVNAPFIVTPADTSIVTPTVPTFANRNRTQIARTGRIGSRIERRVIVKRTIANIARKRAIFDNS